MNRVAWLLIVAGAALELWALTACGDDLTVPPGEPPSCEPCAGQLVCEDDDGTIADDPLACSCDGEVCEPRGFDCCRYMPDIAAVGLCEERHIRPSSCGWISCGQPPAQLIIFCRPEE